MFDCVPPKDSKITFHEFMMVYNIMAFDGHQTKTETQIMEEEEKYQTQIMEEEGKSQSQKMDSMKKLGKSSLIFERMFDLFDVDGDGVITKDEMKKVVKDLMIILEEDNINNNTNALEIFKQMDTNKDEKITKDEFVNSIMSDNTFGQNLAAKLSELFGKHIASTSKGQISS